MDKNAGWLRPAVKGVQSAFKYLRRPVGRTSAAVPRSPQVNPYRQYSSAVNNTATNSAIKEPTISIHVPATEYHDPRAQKRLESLISKGLLVGGAAALHNYFYPSNPQGDKAPEPTDTVSPNPTTNRLTPSQTTNPVLNKRASWEAAAQWAQENMQR